MTARLQAALRQELRDRLTLARHARRCGFQITRRFHVEFALAARRKLQTTTHR